MKRCRCAITLVCGVLLTCCGIEAQLDQLGKKADATSRSDKLPKLALNNAGSQSDPLQFIPVTACRVVDTRGPDGTFGGPPIQGGTHRSFPIPQGAGDIPSTAAAYSLNVRVIPHESLQYLTHQGADHKITALALRTDNRFPTRERSLPCAASSPPPSLLQYPPCC